ncbi:MAG: precorrin-2 C(20)-methyltransferase [Pseudomonadota bacterium]
MSAPGPGTVTCVGLGPGAADLMTVRADRLIRAARHIAYFRKAGRAGQARRIVEGMLPADATEYPMEYPVTTEIPFDDPAYRACLKGFYEGWADRLAALAEGGADIAVLCEGDPFFYGSFMHLHARLADRVPVVVIPGVTGMSGAWTATDVPITWGDDVLTVLTGTLSEAQLADRAAGADALVVMKVGRNLPKIRSALERAGRLADAWVVCYATMQGQSVRRLTDCGADPHPYFSIVLVHGQGRRP